MKIVRSIIIPTTLIGCLLVAWIGTMANSSMTYKATNMVMNNNSGNNQNNSQEQSTSRSCSLSEKFPEKILKWCELIIKYGEENSIPAGLIGAVMLQESGGNPQAYSASGAVGLLQVMPRDGIAAAFQCINGPCFANRPSIKELLDPEYNISYGTAMLSSLNQRYKSYREALMYYGPAGIGYTYSDKVLALWSKYQP